MPAVAQRREELSGIADAGEGQHRPPLQRGERLRIRLEPAVEHRRAPLARRRDDRLGRRALADHQHASRVRELALRAAPAAGRPETPCRCRCRARPSTTRIERSFLQAGILEAVVHHDRHRRRRRARRPRRRRGRARRSSARRAPAAAARRRRRRRDARRIDLHRAGRAAAIAAAEHERPPAGRRQHLRDRNRGRRLAGAAQRQIADADHRNARVARPAAPSAAPRPRHRSRPAAHSSPAARPAGRHQNAGSRIVRPRRSSRNCIR